MNSRKLVGEKMNLFPWHLYFFRFARLAANTFISQGVPVYLFSDIIPTPFVVGSPNISSYIPKVLSGILHYLHLKKTDIPLYFLRSVCS